MQVVAWRGLYYPVKRPCPPILKIILHQAPWFHAPPGVWRPHSKYAYYTRTDWVEDGDDEHPCGHRIYFVMGHG